MTILQAILLGVLQGLTEFLPVSSSGHLALAESFFGVESPGVTFEVFVHFGTALAVVIFFWKRVIAVVASVVRWVFRLPHEADNARLGFHLLLGTIPAGVVGFLLEDRVEAAFGSPALVSVLLIATGVILMATRRFPEGTKTATTRKDAIVIGCAQALAILPGISRSGSTIAAGFGAGLERRAAAEFAFLLSIPVILGATAASLGDALDAGAAHGAAIAAGTVAAFLSAIPAIMILLRAVTAGKFSRFAWYCWAVGIIGLILSFVRS
jgi:undecaprenyl-diphosphatase